ncbi:MAG: hypothetical protein ABI182_08135 [Candidatus Baltobacteraceae bacterium]
MSWLRTIFGFVLVAAIAMPAQAESARALSAYSQGQSYARLFQDHLMPGTCGIVLERAQCMDDLHVIETLRGADPTNNFMEQWLASGDVALWKTDWNGIFIPDGTWSANPVFAWWYTAGVASIAASLPQNAGSDDYANSIAYLLVKHSNVVPEAFRRSMPAGQVGLASLAALQSSLEQTAPVVPYPAVSFENGFAADARLGIYVSTLRELFDNPLALSRPESRNFGLMVIRRLQQSNAAHKRPIEIDDLERILSSNAPLDLDAIDLQMREPLSQSGADLTWPEAPRKAFLLGALIAQVAYNAAVLKDTGTDHDLRNAIASFPLYEGISNDATSAIKSLALVRMGDWSAINTVATAATLAIMAQQ